MSIRGWGVAAAAALALVSILALELFTPPDDASTTSDQELVLWDPPLQEPSTAADPHAGTQLTADLLGSELLAGVWVEEFDRVADDCAVVAFIRAWDETCACLRWRQHQWVDADGQLQTSQTLESGDRLELEFEVPGATPPVEQMVLVATADSIADLPTSAAATQQLLDCLAEPQCLEDPDAMATYVSTAPGCFGSGVRLIPRSFVVR